ncbi:hypothetical protein F2Q69_00026010 [Brassica cretica]|uniref:Uncharacterized protein n=1 Tax=Brassica cretica TaxID=69181 RepID=A0A8S9SB34_BRACR|nr:hypothetical protein F2Q69_00026010 [Brassica cretica]
MYQDAGLMMVKWRHRQRWENIDDGGDVGGRLVGQRFVQFSNYIHPFPHLYSHRQHHNRHSTAVTDASSPSPLSRYLSMNHHLHMVDNLDTPTP